MRVRYVNFRKHGIDMTGREVEMDDEEAKILIKSNIVVPVENKSEVEMETAEIKPSENAMIERKKIKRK